MASEAPPSGKILLDSILPIKGIGAQQRAVICSIQITKLKIRNSKKINGPLQRLLHKQTILDQVVGEFAGVLAAELLHDLM